MRESLLNEKLDKVRENLSKHLGYLEKDTSFPIHRFKLKENEKGVVTLYFEKYDGKIVNLTDLRTGEFLANKSIIYKFGGEAATKRILNIGEGIDLNSRDNAAFNRASDNLPSTSKINKAGDIELQEIVENVIDNTENLTDSIRQGQETRTDDSLQYPMRELLAFDRQLKTIRGSLRSEIGKRIYTENHIGREEKKLQEMKNYPEIYTDEQKNEVMDRVKNLNDDLTARKEEIDILRGKLKSQITGIKETIAKVRDSDTSLAEKIRTIFREQGVTIAAILTALGAVVAAIVEALTGSSPSILPSSSTSGGGGGGK